MDALLVEVRQLEESELPLLERHVPRFPELHRRRWQLQHQGVAVYLVAWHEDRLLGHALVTWAGTTREPMASRVASCPVLSDLFVTAEYRSRGVGTCLLTSAEELSRQRRYARLGLFVALGNVRARALYERLGYEDSNLGTYVSSWVAVDARGRQEQRQEECAYLIKALG